MAQNASAFPAPPITIPFVDQRGLITDTWYRWLLTLFLRTGGSGGMSIDDLKAFSILSSTPEDVPDQLPMSLSGGESSAQPEQPPLWIATPQDTIYAAPPIWIATPQDVAPDLASAAAFNTPADQVSLEVLQPGVMNVVLQGRKNSVGVEPDEQSPAGFAITSNYDGFGEVNFWNTVDVTSGFQWWQKTSGAPFILGQLYGDGSTFVEFDFYGPINFIVGSTAAEAFFGTSSAADVTVFTNNVNRMRFDAAGDFVKALTPTFALTGVAFASLPGTPTAGMIAYITNSTTATWGATIAGGGANAVLGWYNGANWTVIGA